MKVNLFVSDVMDLKLIRRVFHAEDAMAPVNFKVFSTKDSWRYSRKKSKHTLLTNSREWWATISVRELQIKLLKFMLQSLVMVVEFIQSKESDINAVYVLISISVTNAKLRRLILILCSRSEELNMHQLSLSVLIAAVNLRNQRIKISENLDLENQDAAEEKMEKRKYFTKPDL